MFSVDVHQSDADKTMRKLRQICVHSPFCIAGGKTCGGSTLIHFAPALSRSLNRFVALQHDSNDSVLPDKTFRESDKLVRNPRHCHALRSWIFCGDTKA